MKIEKLWIKDYHKYYNQWIIFDSNINEVNFQKEIFGKMNVTLFSGENGSGKSTILSFIAHVFRYLQRYRNKMPSDYILQYSITVNGVDHRICLSMLSKRVFISVDGEDAKYVQEYNHRAGGYIGKGDVGSGQVTYDDISRFLPSTVCVIGFDIMYRGLNYGPNYWGDKKVVYRNMSSAYSDTNRGAYNSKGVLYFYYKLSTNSRLRKMLISMGLELVPYVDIKINVSSKYPSEYPYVEDDFGIVDSKFSEEIIKLYKESNLEAFIFEIDGYNERFKILDYLTKKKNVEILNRLIEEGAVYINEYYIYKNGETIPINGMSTGEKTFLYNLFSVCAIAGNNALIIWEEPENHLNIKWAKNLIPMMVELFKIYNLQILLSSHSPYMIKDLFQNQILLFRGEECCHPEFNTFMANDAEIRRKLFDDVTLSLFEEKVIKYMKGSEEQQEELFGLLGESYLRFMLFKYLER